MKYAFASAAGFILGGALSALISGSILGLIPGLIFAGVTLLIAGFRG